MGHLSASLSASVPRVDPGRSYKSGRLRNTAGRRSGRSGTRSPGPFPKAQLIGGDNAVRANGRDRGRICRGAGARSRSAARCAGYSIPAARLAGPPRDPSGIHRELQGDCRTHRSAEGGARCSAGMCLKPTGRGDSLSPRSAYRTERHRAIAGESSGNSRCWTGKPPHDGRLSKSPVESA